MLHWKINTVCIGHLFATLLLSSYLVTHYIVPQSVLRFHLQQYDNKSYVKSGFISRCIIGHFVQ